MNHYPYFQFILIAMVVYAVFFPIHYVFRVLLRYVNIRTATAVKGTLQISQSIIFVLFIVVLLFTLISIHHVNTQLGFSYATPETPRGEVFLITKVLPGSIMANAGLQREDHVQMRNVNNLYKLLIYNQGEEVVIPVLRNNEQVEIRVLVPAMDLPLAKFSFLVL